MWARRNDKDELEMEEICIGTCAIALPLGTSHVYIWRDSSENAHLQPNAVLGSNLCKTLPLSWQVLWLRQPSLQHMSWGHFIVMQPWSFSIAGSRHHSFAQARSFAPSSWMRHVVLLTVRESCIIHSFITSFTSVDHQLYNKPAYKLKVETTKSCVTS